MNDRVEFLAREPAQQIVRRNEIGQLALGEVAPFLIAAEQIVHHHVVAARLVEARYHVRSDKPCPARH
jgi:hypothetical protein